MKNENLKSKLKSELGTEGLTEGEQKLEVLNPDALDAISGGALSEAELSADCGDFKCGAYDNCGLK